MKLPRPRSALAALAVLAVLLRLTVYWLAAQPFGPFADTMCQYDCGWYLRIGFSGYGADAEFANYGALPHWAFFPLFPLLLRLSFALLHATADLASQEVAGMVAANLLYVGFILTAFAYASRTRPTLDRRLLLLVLVVSPYGYFFSAVYTEGLFNLLLLAAVMMLAERRMLACATLTALLCATRPTGVLMLLPIGIERLRHLWRGRTRPDRMALLGETLLPLAIAPLGLSLFMAAQYISVGDGLAFSHVQILWDRHWIGPLTTLTHGMMQEDWANLLTPTAPPSQSYDAAWALLGLGLAGFLAWRRRWMEAWLLAAGILLPASTALHSLPRFVATSPFVLLTLAQAIARVQLPHGRLAIFILLAVLHLATLGLWFIGANSAY
ncbi:MAG: mannosyltransferase family protein [Acetobacteraceae bacterium]|nr:mannosyltransferase family protein [Acetobacteraceae bacterium]